VYSYIARVSDKQGRKLAESGLHPTREAAAAEVFKLRPNAKTASTSRVRDGFPAIGGFDIQWIDRRNMPATTEES